MHYPKVLERVGSPEQIFHRSFSLGAPEKMSKYRIVTTHLGISDILATVSESKLRLNLVNKPNKNHCR